MGEQRGDGEEMETGNGRLGSWLGVRKRKRCGDEVETARKLERTGGNGQDSGKIAINNKTRTHPFLAGNFWPVKGESELQSCRRVRGAIPAELAGGQYIRNGGNSFFPPGQGQGYHFFDGDGMLHGVYFKEDDNGTLTPHYVNKYIHTDILAASKKRGSTLVPSIASLISPITKYPIHLLLTLIRTVSICYLSSLTRLSAANTLVVFHNRKLLATCESGPMMRISAPELNTHGWEVFHDEQTGQGLGTGTQVVGKHLGSAARMLEEWTTGHPKVCPVTGDLVFFGYNIFAAPYVTYSVVRQDGRHTAAFKTPIPGIKRPKMMHDFGCSLHHSIILDLPLTMDPLNIVLAQPMLSFNRTLPSRFVVVPRYFDGKDESQVKVFESSEPSLIFHTCDAWDEGCDGNQFDDTKEDDEIVAINFYGCRFQTSEFVYGAGGMRPPEHEDAITRQLADRVRLTYYRFSMSDRDPLRNAASSSSTGTGISHAFCLSAIPFEFPVISEEHRMRQHRFAYGCTTTNGKFDAFESPKTDCIVKMDIEALRLKGIEMSSRGEIKAFAEVDKRLPNDILQQQALGVIDSFIQVFAMPQGVYLQEPSFVPREHAVSEDDGYLLFYAYDEAQLNSDGSAPEDSKSQLYIVDAAKMASTFDEAVVAVIDLPARVPYGLHSAFITAEQIDSQILKLPGNAVSADDLRGSAPSSFVNEAVAAADQLEEIEETLKITAGLGGSVGGTAFLLWMGILMSAIAARVEAAHYSPQARQLRSNQHRMASSSLSSKASTSSLAAIVMKQIREAHYSPQALAAR